LEFQELTAHFTSIIVPNHQRSITPLVGEFADTKQMRPDVVCMGMHRFPVFARHSLAVFVLDVPEHDILIVLDETSRAVLGS
jgi:hypothetical protein